MQVLSEQALVDQLHAKSVQVERRVWIASPFIGSWENVAGILGLNGEGGRKVSVRLLTNLSGGGQFVNADTLRRFRRRGEVRQIPALHAKVYILDDYALVSSANLTKTAFTKRLEIGILLSPSEATEVINLYEDWWQNEATGVEPDQYPRTRRGARYRDEPLGKGLPPRNTLPPRPTPGVEDSQPEIRARWRGPDFGAALQLVDAFGPLIQEVDPRLRWWLKESGKDKYAIIGNARGPFNESPRSDDQIRLTLNKGGTVKITALLKAPDAVRKRWEQRLRASGLTIGSEETQKAEEHPGVRVERVSEKHLNAPETRAVLVEFLREAYAWLKRSVGHASA